MLLMHSNLLSSRQCYITTRLPDRDKTFRMSQRALDCISFRKNGKNDDYIPPLGYGSQKDQIQILSGPAGLISRYTIHRLVPLWLANALYQANSKQTLSSQTVTEQTTASCHGDSTIRVWSSCVLSKLHLGKRLQLLGILLLNLFGWGSVVYLYRGTRLNSSH